MDPACESVLARLARPPPLGALLLLDERVGRLHAAAKMGQTSGPSTRASGRHGRRGRVEADETHAADVDLIVRVLHARKVVKPERGSGRLLAKRVANSLSRTFARGSEIFPTVL
jgi:hypothetical protein